MKRIHLLLYLLITSVISVVAQPSSTNVLNSADYIPSDAPALAVYNSSSNSSAFTTLVEGLTISDYVAGAVYISGGAYKEASLDGLSIPLGTGDSRIKYVYFVYSGTINDYFSGYYNTTEWFQFSNFRNIKSINGWTLGVIEIPDNVTGNLTKINFQTGWSSELYLGNIYCSNYTIPNDAPSIKDIPDPSTDYLPSGYTATPIYNSTTGDVSSITLSLGEDDDSATPVVEYGSNDGAVTSTIYKWAAMVFPTSVSAGKLKYIYFAYSGALNSVFIDWESITYETLATYDSGWSLARAIVPDNITTISTLRIATYNDNERPFYLANIYAFVIKPTTLPTPPPNRSSCTYLSLYNESPYNTPDPNWDSYNATNSPLTIGSGEVQQVSFDQNTEARTRLVLDQTEDVSSYQYLYFDLWLPEPIDPAYLSVLLMHPNWGTEGSNYGEFVERPIRVKSDDDNDDTLLPAGEWIPIEMSLDKFQMSWDTNGLSYLDIISNVKSFAVYAKPSEKPVTFYVDNIYFYSPVDPYLTPAEPEYSDRAVMPIYGYYGDRNGVSWNGTSLYTDSSGNESQQMTLSDGITATVSMDDITSLALNNDTIVNKLYMQVWVETACDDANTNDLKIQLNNGVEYTIPPAVLKEGAWNTVQVYLIRLADTDLDDLIPINSITFSGSGTYFIDDVFLYYSYANLNPVAQLYINDELYGNGNFYSIAEAFQSIPRSGPDVENKEVRIAIIDDSNEPETTRIPVGDWSMLTIYPASVVGESVSEPIDGSNLPVALRTVTFFGDKSKALTLFDIENNASNITFSGWLDNDHAKDSLQLAFVGKHFDSNPEENLYNSIISGVAMDNVTIDGCLFTSSESSISESVISGSGTNMTVTNNHFVNCIYPGYVSDFNNNPIINVYSHASTNHGWEISNNHFYGTDVINFTAPIFRMFINVEAKDLSNAEISNPIRIVNNKIGGSGREKDENGNIIITGTLVVGENPSSENGNLGNNYDPKNDPENNTMVTASSLFGIHVKSMSATGDAMPLIADNEIANISIINPTTGMYRGSSLNYSYEPYYMGEFTGISITDGNAIITGNKIHDITNISRSRNDNSERYSYINLGMRVQTEGGMSTAIIDGNDIYNLYGDVFENDLKQTGVVQGIRLLQKSWGGGASTGIVRNNRIIIGHEGTKDMSFDFAAIDVAIDGAVQSDATLNQYVYNNVAVANQMAYKGSTDCSMFAIALSNYATNNNGVINSYNNIAYLQPKTSDDFNTMSPIEGIHYVGLSGITNVFHNTVVLSEMEASRTRSFKAAIDDNSTGTLNVWNNNFVNFNPGNVINVYDSHNENVSIYFDYNNYYLPSGASIGFREENTVDGWSGASIKTFDNWKFSNPVSYFDQTHENDYHSRFLDPEFVNAAAITFNGDSTDMKAIEGLRANLVPQRFLGGKKTADSFLNGLPDDTNRDFGITPAERRPNLPTMGAMNTNFTNYYTGTGFVDITPSTSNANSWEQDIVFAEDAAGDLTLSADASVHSIYNDTENQLDINGKTLTVAGYIGLEGSGMSTLSAAGTKSSIVYAGSDGYDGVTYSDRNGAAAQHIFENTFVGNQVNNLVLNNNSEYFVLLHGAKPWNNEEPVGATLNILNDFSVMNANEVEITYPEDSPYLLKGRHLGGLNSTWYNTTLQFSGTNASTNAPNLSGATTYDSNSPYNYRPYTGQRIPRHGIFNDAVYNLVSNSTKVVNYQDSLSVRNDLTINSGKNFEIAAGKYVKVDGTTINSNGTSGLVIKSRELGNESNGTGEYAYNAYLFPKLPRPSATFIYNIDNNDNNIPATVEMYTSSEYVLSDWKSPGGNTYEYRWQYFTAPVTGLSTSVPGSIIYKYNPAGDNNLNGGKGGSPYWTVPAGAPFETFAGYCGYRSANYVYQWKGNLINANLAENLTYQVSPITEEQIEKHWKDFERADGKYLLGNPYTAAIDITKMSFGSDLEATVYVYNTGSNAEWNSAEGNVEGENPDNLYLGTAPGTSMIIPQEYAGKTIPLPEGNVTFPQYIPSMQAFTLVVLNPGSTTASDANKFAFGYDATSRNDMTQRSTVYEPEMSYLLVELKQEGYTDRALLATHPNTKKGFDNGWDGKTTPNASQPLAIFTIEEEPGVALENSYYQISTMDSFEDTYLGILVTNMRQTTDENNNSLEPVEYELVLKHDLAEGTELYLKDLYLSKTIDISVSGTSYKFTEINSGEVQKRFRITTDSGIITGIEEQPAVESYKIYTNNKSILVDNPGEAGSIMIYDITGKCVMTGNMEANTQTRLDTTLESGVYLIKIIAGNKNINQSIILR